MPATSRRLATLWLLVALGLLAGCQPLFAPLNLTPAAPPLAVVTIPSPIVPVVTPTPADVLPSEEALSYLNNAIDILEQHSIERNQVDWVALRANAFARIETARAAADTYDAIRYAVAQLGDHHSRFYTPERAAELKRLTVGDNVPPQARLSNNRLAYLLMPGFVTFNDAQRHLYANQLQALIRDTDAQNPCGWVLDLRQNTGGNIWPMFAGLGPLLGEGEMGAFLYADGTKQVWRYQNGQALLDGHLLEQVDGTPYQLRHPGAPVALLIGPRTQSAGEAVVVAFAGRADTQSFGQPTGGLSTANATYELKDGAAIVLTVVTDADRTGRVYGSALQPDQSVAAQAVDRDVTLDAAEQWLESRPACML